MSITVKRHSPGMYQVLGSSEEDPTIEKRYGEWRVIWDEEEKMAFNTLRDAVKWLIRDFKKRGKVV